MTQSVFVADGAVEIEGDPECDRGGDEGQPGSDGAVYLRPEGEKRSSNAPDTRQSGRTAVVQTMLLPPAVSILEAVVPMAVAM